MRIKKHGYCSHALVEKWSVLGALGNIYLRVEAYGDLQCSCLNVEFNKNGVFEGCASLVRGLP